MRPVPKVVVPEMKEPVRVRVGALDGHACFSEEVHRYLEAPGALQPAASAGAGDLTIAGVVKRIAVNSNRADKEAAMAYFTAFVITAPLAAVMHGMKDWRADAVAEGSLHAVDAAGATVWSKDLVVAVTETQTTTPTEEAVQRAMTRAACQKLAANLLNALAEHLAERHRPR